MKTKAQSVKAANEKQIKTAGNKKATGTQKIPSRMSYHGKDEKKNLNPEE